MGSFDSDRLAEFIEVPHIGPRPRVRELATAAAGLVRSDRVWSHLSREVELNPTMCHLGL